MNAVVKLEGENHIATCDSWKESKLETDGAFFLSRR
jgi:hypothetical protein